MKCPRCLSVCMPDDSVCFSCRQPLGGGTGRSAPSGKTTQAQQLAMIFVVVGVVGGGAVARMFFQPANGASSMAIGGVVGAIGALVFGTLARAGLCAFTRGRREPDSPFDKPLRP